MKNAGLFLGIVLWLISNCSLAQDTAKYRLRLSLPVIDFPQNYDLPHSAPSMQQSLELSNIFYDLGFWGIDALGDRLFVPKEKALTRSRKIGNEAFKYLLGLAFSKYGSELPIPLGVWAHEEFHRSVLGVNGISSMNGNWIFHRWDGTVYGVTDSTLSHLKNENNSELLYSYVAGVQYEIALNKRTTLEDFYKRRTLAKNALLLYNAWYVYDYFRFSAGPISDSVKVLAPPHENTNPKERDFAGADLTAWAYDMFNPDIPYSTRDSFPGGDGVNRRVGFADLSPEAQLFLKEQKKLSLLNFINPSIFFINRIKINDELSFNFFSQYAPTHFGNAIAVFVPLKYRTFDLLFDIHKYASQTGSGLGIGVGLFNYRLSEKLETDIKLDVWNQPETFSDPAKISGGQIHLCAKYLLKSNFSGFVNATGKTRGWTLANPYLGNNLSVQVGLKWHLVKK